MKLKNGITDGTSKSAITQSKTFTTTQKNIVMAMLYKKSITDLCYTE